jgi:hypothetical protein
MRFGTKVLVWARLLLMTVIMAGAGQRVEAEQPEKGPAESHISSALTDVRERAILLAG